MGDSGEARFKDAAACELCSELLDEDSLSWGQFGSLVCPNGSASPIRVGACDTDPHRRAPLKPDEQHVLALCEIEFHDTADCCRKASTVATVGDRVVLLSHGPEPINSGEGQLGTGHLLDAPTASPDLVD